MEGGKWREGGSREGKKEREGGERERERGRKGREVNSIVNTIGNQHLVPYSEVSLTQGLPVYFR